MKFATEYFGIQILAEDDTDKAILESLVSRLPKKAERTSDLGDWEIITEGHRCGYFFSDEEIKSSQLVVQFICSF